MKQGDNNLFLKPRKTFMELLKVHKQEVPFANILAFFFRPKESHNLGTLFLNALLTTKQTNIIESINNEKIEETPIYDEKSVKVKVEQPTEYNKRIDILITTNTFVICIEFKINHDLDNPLSDYKKFIENTEDFKNKKHYYFILTPYKKEPIYAAKNYFENHNEFKQIILRHFINQVDIKIKENPKKYLKNEKFDYFDDFVQTVRNREIRSKRYIYLNNLEKELSNENIIGKYHQNINGGFLEIKREKYSLKIRFKSDGIQIEKWKKTSKEIIYKPNKDLKTGNLIAVIKNNL